VWHSVLGSRSNADHPKKGVLFGSDSNPLSPSATSEPPCSTGKSLRKHFITGASLGET
jgi:hypothetical protein